MSTHGRSLLFAAAAVLVGGALEAGAAGSVAPSGLASGSASKVIDRTLSCTTRTTNGLHKITIESTSGFREAGELKWLGSVAVSGGSDGRRHVISTLVAMQAGWPPPPPQEATGFGYSSTLCKPTRASVAFSTRGLSGGLVPQIGDEVKCLVTRTVIVRVRGVFRTPTQVKLGGGFYMANSRLDRGQVAVRTPGGKRLVYGEVLDSTRARVFTARGCA